MAAIYKHSFKEKEISRFGIGNKIKNNCVVDLVSDFEINSYFRACNKKALYNFDGHNWVLIRINTQNASLLKDRFRPR
jgi:hypothetical protein